MENPWIIPKSHRAKLVDTAEGYDLWSSRYDHDFNPLIVLDAEVMPRLVGDVQDRQLLDLGCGTGRNSLRMADAGARVTAVDFSPGMLDQARAKDGAGRIHFLHHNLHERLPFDDGAFDCITCCLVLDHVLQPAVLFAEMARVCRHGGIVAITTMHPGMMLRGVLAHFDDPESGVKIYPRSAPNQMQDYINGILAADLKIEVFEEFFGDEAMAAAHPAMKKYIRWPLLAAFRLRR